MTILPTTRSEAVERGWAELDVVLVSADAYVDHPAFAVGMLGRVLEAAGYRVGVLSQPNWRSADGFRELGRPRLFFGVSGGNTDSMLAHYTPRRRSRREDPYSPGGEAGRRPDRATAVYAQRCREAYRDVPVVIGGIEASLRRLSHWDHHSRKVRPSLLLSSKADLLVYGMGERAVVDIAEQLDRDGDSRPTLPSSCRLLGRKQAVAALDDDLRDATEIPSHEACLDDPGLISEVTRAVCRQAVGDPPVVQWHGDRLVVHQAPAPPPSTTDLDRWYALPFTRRVHPSVGGLVPALETVRWSVVTHRGCFGGCSFCSLAEHQGRSVVARSPASIVHEVEDLARMRDFAGEISDLGGPSANMYGLGCSDADTEAHCRRRSCLWPKVCKKLRTAPDPWLGLLAAARRVAGVRRVRIASGVRMDLLLMHPRALRTVARHHVGGQLKVAPEHDCSGPLRAMRKYTPGTLRKFKRAFDTASAESGHDQYLVPYLIAGHPGTTLDDMAALAMELKALGLRPRQVQDFTPTPMTPSTAQHLTGRDPLSGEVTTPCRGERARADQRALLQWFLPQHRQRAEVLLRRLGRQELLSQGRPRARRKR